VKVTEGQLVDPGGNFAVIAGRFNDFIVERLIAGCRDGLRLHGIDPDTRAELIWVPGAMEIPLAASLAAQSGRFAGIIALGAVIRGATPHFDLVSNAVANGCGRVALDQSVPVSFGVLTTDTVEQAIERAGTKAGNNGWNAALAAIQMVSLQRALGA